MKAYKKTRELMYRLNRAGISADFDDAKTLRRAEATLHAWCESECGNSNDYASWCLERDETTGKPFRCVYSHYSNKVQRYATPDRERGALTRVKAVCDRLGVFWHYQGDCRGASLYVSTDEITGSNYTNGVCCCMRD